MMSESQPLRLGTRGSPLAVTQTEWIAARVRERLPGVEIEIRTIRTSGDRLSGPLHAVGGKGLFIKEIEEALLAGEIDAGVHSLKDLPATIPEGLAIAAVPVREDARDALVSGRPGGLAGLVRGARIGTGSLRRQALLRHLRPDLEVVELRGNVETRLRKWRSGEVDAVVLALAGIRRLGLDLPEAEPLAIEQFLPAIGQGALAVEASLSGRWCSLLATLNDEPAARTAAAERSFLVAVGGDCKTPIAAHAQVSGTLLRLRGLIADPSGRRVVDGHRLGSARDAEVLGQSLAAELLDRGGRSILAELAS